MAFFESKLDGSVLLTSTKGPLSLLLLLVGVVVVAWSLVNLAVTVFGDVSLAVLLVTPAGFGATPLARAFNLASGSALVFTELSYLIGAVAFAGSIAFGFWMPDASYEISILLVRASERKRRQQDIEDGLIDPDEE